MRRILPILFLALASLAAAQSSDAPQPSVDVQTIYLHGTGNDEYVAFMNAQVEDGGDTALGSGDALNGEQVWTFDLAPALAQTLVLDPAGTVDMTLYVGGSQAIGSVDVSWELTAGESLAIGDAESHTITPASAGDGLYGELTWSAAPALERIEAGTPMTLTVTVDGQASAVFIGVGEARGRSNFVLPIIAVEGGVAGPGVTYGNLTEVDLSFSFTNATDHIYVYNWTNDGLNRTAVLSGALDNGSVQVILNDQLDSNHINDLQNGTLDGRWDIRGDAGNWSLSLVFTEAIGNATLQFIEVVASDGGEDPVDPGDDDHDHDDHDHGNETGDEGKDSPGAPWLVLGVGLLVIALRRRP